MSKVSINRLFSDHKKVSEELFAYCKEIGESDFGPVWDKPLHVYKNTESVLLAKDEVLTPITIETLLKNYIEHVLSKFTPEAVSYCYDYEFIYYYPQLETILDGARHLVFDNLPTAWCVHIEEPYIFSQKFFQILGDYIVWEANQISLYQLCFKTQCDIPIITCSTEIERIHSVNDFYEWIRMFNYVIEHAENGCASIRYYLSIAEEADNFDLSAKWVGKDEDLTQLPLFVNVKLFETIQEAYCVRFNMIEEKMQVSIDDDYRIHIKRFR